MHAIKIDINRDWEVSYYSASYDLDKCSTVLAAAFRKNVKETASFKQNLESSVSVRVIKSGITEIAARKMALEKLMSSKWFIRNNGKIIEKLSKGHQSAQLLAADLVAVHKQQNLAEQPYDWAATSGLYG
jgi:hypothetical protein